MGKAECSVTGSMTMGVGMVVIVIMAGGVRAADPDPVQDYAVDAKSFVVRDIFKQGEILHDTGGVRAALTTANFPAITTQGITYVRVRIVACGCTLAHSHPRATEIMTLISGGPLQVASLTPRTAAAALFKVPKRALASSLNIPWHLLDAINTTISKSTGPSIQKVARSECIPGQDVSTRV